MSCGKGGETGRARSEAAAAVAGGGGSGAATASVYSKGLLSEILDFVMGTGLIPADGEVWKTRRRAVVPALHKKYVASMVGMFGDCALHGAGGEAAGFGV
ncbi:hypothetical protein MNEG_14871 [Monoraphidium neglectum]|uniref:Uncharacterized protein n=1 Tax=Monoraphidium neglectum TaxID=145388 RepID=A0A0D2KAU2_9CHLO|nr:hypothetical protein MNEG_14871 [Monoraphidium neglectum]KIY93093.1 hypothetical protein MNEG_14871 [Monoraphidium neglectum]|eukprot:XP_013892113.1 hypothetical protein MNEG_14871 [Monoraphidium neglectum]